MTATGYWHVAIRYPVGTIVLDKTGTLEGRVRGQRGCNLSGCNGIQLNVLWPDGRRTWPCTKGMHEIDNNKLMILG